MTLEENLKHSFAAPDLLKQALTHKSYHNEYIKESVGHNERLEFLGDAVLDLVISQLLMEIKPDFREGPMSKARASLVNESYLADLAVEMGIDKELKLGRGELKAGGAAKPRLLASAFEAVVGAYFLDTSYEQIMVFLEPYFRSKIEAIDENSQFHLDYKTRLQEIAQERFRTIPTYEITNEEGPDHEKIFFVELKINDETVSQGQGKTKKQAEQDAARLALEKI